MERKTLYEYSAVFIVLAVLAIVAISDYYYIASLNDQLSTYKKQQKEFSRLITVQYASDMDAARRAWIAANQQENIALQNQNITVEADSLETSAFTVVFDLKDPSSTLVEATPGSDTPPGEVVVYLGQYYGDNMTRVPGWSATYKINTTTHTVDDITPLLVKNIAYQYYVDRLEPTIYQNLGVTNGTVTGMTSCSVDTSHVDTGDWVDVTEYKYSLKYVDFKTYLTIKTYVNATTQEVTGVDISQPYYQSITGFTY